MLRIPRQPVQIGYFHADLIMQKPSPMRGNNQVDVHIGSDQPLNKSLGIKRPGGTGNGSDDVHEVL